MAKEILIVPEELTAEAFAPYGKAVLPPEVPAPKTGADWSCWFPLGNLSSGNMQVGIVTTRPTQPQIDAMEREPKTEFLLPISGPVVQAVALPGDLTDNTQQPDASTVKAFIIQPGQAIIMAPGTWHWAALPLQASETLYYFITEDHPPEAGRGPSPWIAFIDEAKVRLALYE